MPRPDSSTLIGQGPHDVPMSCQRLLQHSEKVDTVWIGPEESERLSDDELHAYELAHTIIRHLAVMAPLTHKSGHPGGPLSAFTFSYFVTKMRDPAVDQPYRMSAGHLSVLGYALQYLFGKDKGDERLSSPQAIIDTFRTPSGLPGHIEAGIGDIPFGTGPLGKGPSQALGVALGLKLQGKTGVVDVLLADGDSQEGQVMEAVRLAPALELDNLVVHGDFNDIQLSGLPTKVVAADFPSMLHSAGWRVIEVQNGNDPHQVSTAIAKAREFEGEGKPIFICYYTTMGHGIPLMEEGSNTGSKNFHGTPLSEDEAEEALADLQTLPEVTNEYQSYYESEKKRFAAGSTQTDIPLSFDAKTASGYERTVTEEKGAARKDFGATHILNLMKADDRIVVLHADLAGSGGFNKVEAQFPKRCINVGVAEANMYMMAAGMRQTGLLPITYTFAAFGTYEARANARLIDINCGHTRCGIINDCTHAGLSVGEDGETHQERNYLNIPLDNTQVWMTADSNQAAAMAERALEIIAEGHQSVYTFFPRDGHDQLKSPDGSIIYGPDYTFDGKADLIRGKGTTEDDVTILATGLPVHFALQAADSFNEKQETPADRSAKREGWNHQKLSVRVLNVACVRPLDASAVIQAALETGHLIVVEDHHSDGGLATQVADIIADFALPCSLRRLGVNHYFPSAKAADLYLMAGIDTDSIIDAIEDEVRAEVCGGEDAFVTALSELSDNIHHSRFRETAQSFITTLTKKGYMDELREYWAGRECPKDKLPTNTDLLKKLT